MKNIFNLLFGVSIKKIISNQKDVNNQQYSKEDLIRILDRLYKCRDLEIPNLWQRSVFLSVFLVLCFTGYGYLLLQIVDNIYNALKLNYLHLIASFLGMLSLIFSLLWVLMAKGSKAWYEVYETAITDFEKEYYRILCMPLDYIMGQIGLPRRRMDNNLFSTKSGAYSVSKINILIGQICVLIWISVSIIHIGFIAVNCIFETDAIIQLLILISAFLLLFLLIVFLLFSFSENFIRSKIKKNGNKSFREELRRNTMLRAVLKMAKKVKSSHLDYD